jgi:hypothetical protein
MPTGFGGHVRQGMTTQSRPPRRMAPKVELIGFDRVLLRIEGSRKRDRTKKADAVKVTASAWV